MGMANNIDEWNKDGLLYDLRQYYARIVGDVMIRIAQAREREDYSEYLKALDHLHTMVNQKLDEDDGETEKYQKMINESHKIFNTYHSAFTGQSTNTEERYKVYQELKKIEMWLLKKMDEHQLFGSKYMYDEDEI